MSPTLLPLIDAVNRDLAWHEPDARTLVLRDAADRSYARLVWPRRSRWLAEASAAEGAWTLDWKGWLKQRVEIRAAGGDLVAVLPVSWNYGGSVELPRGRGATYRWRGDDLCGTKWRFTGADGADLLHARLGGWDGSRIALGLEPAIRRLAPADRALLVLLSGYLTTSYAEEAVGAVVAAT